MAPSGSNWTISPISSPTMCLDAGAGTNSTAIVVSGCNGGASQAWSITPDVQTGNFFVKASNTGRCINVRNGSTAAGTVMEVYDCNTTWTSEKFAIQATVYAGDQTGAVVNQTGGSGTTPCASYCSGPTEMASQSDSLTNISTNAVCYETTYPVTGFNCGNMSGRTFSVNGQTINCGGNMTLPAKVNGGYCFQMSAGGTSSAYFGTW
jgi:cytidine deaminase